MDAALWERGQEMFAAKLEAQRKGGLLETLPSIPGEAVGKVIAVSLYHCYLHCYLACS